LAVVNKTLKANNLHEKAKEMIEKTHQANSYEEALSIIGEYVEIC
jgi:23S rRNA maturation mini-RNase III